MWHRLCTLLVVEHRLKVRRIVQGKGDNHMTVHDIVIGLLLFFPWALIAVGLLGAGLQRGGIQK
jgi:hypothetical protein